jgi:hypothetical protein
MANIMPIKIAANVEPYYLCWASKATGLNTGAEADTGELQGATISTATWTVPTGITKDSSNQSQVVIHGVTYAVNTVCTVWLSGGTAGVDYTLTCTIVTSDSRTLVDTITVPVR